VWQRSGFHCVEERLPPLVAKRGGDRGRYGSAARRVSVSDLSIGSELRVPLALLVLCLALPLASCGGRGAATVRIGVLADCEGIAGYGREASYAGAELALIQHGARTLGPAPANGVSETQVSGKQIQLALGCGDGTGQTALSEARRLVDQLGANVLIGPALEGEALALKDYAKRRPATTFIEANATAQSLTLDDPAPNVFRFTADGAQLSAGLGAYAYRTLGWRTAVTVGHDDGPFVLEGFEYTQVAGFVAEFCALGGKIIKRVWSSPREVSAYAAGGRADGFFVADPGDFETEFGALRGSLAKRIVGGYWLGEAPLLEPELEQRLAGVVTGGWQGQPPTELTPAWRDYLAAMQTAFPGLLGLDAQIVTAFAYYVDMEAVIEALERVHGDLSGGERRFQAALAKLRFNSPLGPIQLDENRQSVAANVLGQLQRSPDGAVTYRTIRVVPNVDESFGGYFRTNGPPPSESYPPCRRGDPPSWAHSG
jgi:branched-chain amino acid transport system substrate-binding protein